MATIRTDSDVVRIARQIDAHLFIVRGLLYDLEESEHPNAVQIKEALEDNQLGAFSWATHVVSHELIHPERWETGNFGIRYKGKASYTANLLRLTEEVKDESTEHTAAVGMVDNSRP